MLQDIVKLGFQITGLILLQFVIFSNINFFGFINPYPYIFLLLLFRLDGSLTTLLFIAFFSGLFLDITLQSHGAHTIALLVTSFVRSSLCQFTIGVNADYAPTVWESGAKMGQQTNFLVGLIIVHHLTYFSIIFFSWSALPAILIHTLSSGLFTFLILWLTLMLYQKNR
jgi:hypothetical protein